MRSLVVFSGLFLLMVLPMGCATTSAAQKGLEQDADAAKQQATGAADEAKAAGAEAEAMGEGWKDKALEASSAAMGCSKDEVKIDNWQGVLDGSWDAQCGDNMFSCAKSDEGSVSCEPKSAEE